MLSVYGDESSDHRCERVFTVAVLFGDAKYWESLEPKWIARTGGKPFHATDCETDHGDYKHNTHEENMALYRDLTILLAESGIAGFGSNVDLQAQGKYLYRLSIKPQDTYYKCFWDAIEALQSFAGQLNEVAECTFDSRSESDFNAGYLYSQLRECYPQWAPRLASKISFESSQNNWRIQVADLWTRESMKALDNHIGPTIRTRKSMDALLKTGRFLTYSYSENWFKDFSADFKSAMKRLGFDPQKMMEWYHDKHLPQNFANTIRYLNPLMKEHSRTIR